MKLNQNMTNSELIAHFNEMAEFPQVMTIRKALLKTQEEELEQEILKGISTDNRYFVLGIIGDIAVLERAGENLYTASVRTQFADSQDVKWIPIYNHSFTVDGAILLGLGYKYHGANTQFATFAEKMLGVAE